MKHMIFAFLLAISPNASFAVNAIPPSWPPIEPPPLQNYPDCPESFWGQTNGIYYYGTVFCPNPTIKGSGQSPTQLNPPCCNGATCSCPVMAAGAIADPAYGSPAKDASPTPEVAPVPALLLNACGTSGTPEEKLQAIKIELTARIAYLQKLSASNEMAPRSKDAVNPWLSTLTKVQTYLASPMITTDMKIAKYCPIVPETDKKWDDLIHLTTLEIPGRLQIIHPIKQTSLPNAQNVVFTPQTGVTSDTVKLLKVTVSQLPGSTTQTVYYKTAIVRKGGVWMQTAIQVNPNGLTEDETATISDRHSFCQKIRTSTGATFVASSFDDLSIAP